MKKTYLIFIILMSCLFSSAYAQLPKNNQGLVVTSLAPMLKTVMPAVVNISVHGEVTVMHDPFERPHKKSEQHTHHEHPIQRKFQSLGSGVIVDAKHGYIVTNAHVVKQSKAINVTLKDGRRFTAKVIGADAATDIAVLQIKADELHALPLAESDNLEVGDSVAAIGSPFGLNQTVTSGIVSALHRSYLGIEGYENFIQTDASINPGNSGGALVDLHGQLIGINTAILATGGGNLGIGFAIPANMANTVVSQLIKYGHVNRGLLGIFVQPLTPNLAHAMGLKNIKGAIVSKVSPNSPASIAGFKAGDIIQAIDGKRITDAFQVQNTIGLLRVGSSVEVKLLRNGKHLTFTPVIADPKAHKKQIAKNNPHLNGVAMKNVDEIIPPYGLVKGVGVLAVNENSPAWSSHLRPGDVIVSANQHEISNMQQLEIEAKKNKHQLLVNVLRHGGALFLVIKS